MRNPALSKASVPLWAEIQDELKGEGELRMGPHQGAAS